MSSRAIYRYDWLAERKHHTVDQRTYTAVEPDGNLLLLADFFIGAGEEPEEEVALLVCLVGDWQLSSVGLANVEGDFGEGGSIDSEFYSPRL